MDDQRNNPEGGVSVNRLIKSTPRDRIVAGILALIYAVLMGLAFYLESIHIEDYWPNWSLWAGGVAGFAILFILPLFVVRYLFWGTIFSTSLWRFSLRKMLGYMLWISFFVWFFTQVHWKIQRSLWRSSNRAAALSTQGQAPTGLRLFGEPGESRIEIKNGTKQQIAEAKRLFPEATVVAAGKVSEPAAGK